MLAAGSEDEFWCPLGDGAAPPALASDERDALVRLAEGDWVSDAQLVRLEALGLSEKAFGQALLTRQGRAALARLGGAGGGMQRGL